MRFAALADSLRGLTGASGDGSEALWWPLTSFCRFALPTDACGRNEVLLRRDTCSATGSQHCGESGFVGIGPTCTTDGIISKIGCRLRFGARS